MASTAQPVTVSLSALAAGSVSFDTLHQAFGPDSLGILLVRDVAGDYAHLRRLALSYASHLAHLPTTELEKLEVPQAKYLIGWSRGKETLRDGRADTHKGSYYINCRFYAEGDRQRRQDAAEEGAFPEYLAPSIWPSEDVLPGFQPALISLCRLIIDVAILVARACDCYAQKHIVDYPPQYLERVVATSRTTKARLLHYFPPSKVANRDRNGAATLPTEAVKDEDNDDWCATHLDHGCLTGLTSAMFIDEASQYALGPSADRSSSASPSSTSTSLEELAASPDPSAGLYIRSRAGELVQVRIPRDCLAFQTGEALERITAGRFRAVPHFVRGVRPDLAGHGRIARNTLAVFTQPNLDEEVDREGHMTFGEFARATVAKNTVA